MYKRSVAVMLILCFLPGFSFLYLKKKQQNPNNNNNNKSHTPKENYAPPVLRPGVILT